MTDWNNIVFGFANSETKPKLLTYRNLDLDVLVWTEFETCNFS